jgi:hypothetical protein
MSHFHEAMTPEDVPPEMRGEPSEDTPMSFVDGSVIRARMDRKDARINREVRKRMQGVKEMTLLPADESAPVAETQIAVKPNGDLLPMIERLAALKEFDVEKLKQLLDMQERILDRNAEAAFNTAFADMQAEIPTVIEKGKTDKGKYAKQEDIVETVKPILKKYGFSISFRTEWPDKMIKIVGILTHRDGHARTSEFLTDADTQTGRNAIQARGSAVTYGRRYTTTDLLNITSREQRDDDGRGTSKPDPPEGFTKYWTQLKDAADKGTAALEAVWACSQDEPWKSYRNYIAQYGSSEIQALRVTAKKVTP